MKKFDYRKLPSRQMTEEQRELAQKTAMPKWRGKSANGVEYLCCGDTLDDYNIQGYFSAMRYKKRSAKTEYSDCFIDLLNFAHASIESIDRSLIDFYMGKITFDELNPELFKNTKVKDSLIKFAETLMIEALEIEAKNSKLKKLLLKQRVQKVFKYIDDVCKKKISELQNDSEK